jgi:hypothetical protein
MFPSTIAIFAFLSVFSVQFSFHSCLIFKKIFIPPYSQFLFSSPFCSMSPTCLENYISIPPPYSIPTTVPFSLLFHSHGNSLPFLFQSFTVPFFLFHSRYALHLPFLFHYIAFPLLVTSPFLFNSITALFLFLFLFHSH